MLSLAQGLRPFLALVLYDRQELMTAIQLATGNRIRDRLHDSRGRNRNAQFGGQASPSEAPASADFRTEYAPANRPGAA